MSAAASAKHENFVMSLSYFTHSASGSGAAPVRQTDFTHVGGPSGPSQSSPQGRPGQMDLLTVPSADGVDSKVIQVDEALSASSRVDR
jgi:hypothetical protein